MLYRVSTIFLLVSLGQAAVTKFPGTATTILEFQTKTGSITFNDASLKEILGHQEVVGRKIAVVSVMGAYSKNKNVLLDYFLRFMYTNVSLNLLCGVTVNITLELIILVSIGWQPDKTTSCWQQQRLVGRSSGAYSRILEELQLGKTIEQSINDHLV